MKAAGEKPAAFVFDRDMISFTVKFTVKQTVKTKGMRKMGGGFSSCSCEIEASGQIGENVKGEIDLKVEVNVKPKEQDDKEEKND